jgi:hypothetical protein
VFIGSAGQVITKIPTQISGAGDNIEAGTSIGTQLEGDIAKLVIASKRSYQMSMVLLPSLR